MYKYYLFYSLISSTRLSLILEGPKNEQIKSAVVELHARSKHKYFQRGRI